MISFYKILPGGKDSDALNSSLAPNISSVQFVTAAEELGDTDDDGGNGLVKNGDESTLHNISTLRYGKIRDNIAWVLFERP